MGEFVVGKPALRLNYRVSLPLDLVSAMSLLYRAVPGSGLDPWLVATRRSLPPDLRADLDLLHGFSGRLLYYMEEPVMRFEPLRDDRRDPDFADLIGFLEALPPSAYGEMAFHALSRVHRDLGSDVTAPPAEADQATWRRFLEPGLTTAAGDEALALVREPALLRERTLRLIWGIWEQAYRAEYEERRDTLVEAARLAQSTEGRGFGMAFADLTGNRLPATLVSGLNDVAFVTFCPSYHLGSFVSYILYPPDLVVFFDAPSLVSQAATDGRISAGSIAGGADERAGDRSPEVKDQAGALAGETLLEGLRALGDPNRLRILDLLGEGQLYAQEIVGRLGIAQSAVSRHLSQLERAGLITVQPKGGMKYYAVDGRRIDEIAAGIRAHVPASSRPSVVADETAPRPEGAARLG
ncbi:MAG: metalloregulator ArsR/SmtB family transcription factor [Chloroflexota bacterium]|nr:metalloregulator ArsR/SmtB family transcription factor [Chloroflexota bacterium]